MHEFGIVHNIEDQVRHLLTEHQAARPTRIVVQVSEQDAISPDTMRFAFQHMIDEAGWQDAELDLRVEPAFAVCRSCHHRFEYHADVPPCPRCGATDTRPEPSPGPVLLSVEME